MYNIPARSGLASSQGQPLFALDGSMVVKSSRNEPSTIISFRFCQVLVVHLLPHRHDVTMHLLAHALALVIFDCSPASSFLQYKTCRFDYLADNNTPRWICKSDNSKDASSSLGHSSRGYAVCASNLTTLLVTTASRLTARHPKYKSKQKTINPL